MARDYVFVVNPAGANGCTGKEWKNLFPKLTARLGKDCNVHEAFTSGPLHAIDIARQAIKDGAFAVVAVGGDGTFHEVVNGFFEDRKPVESKRGANLSRTALGLIPLGTGSDFAKTFSWSNNPIESIERIAKGQRQRIDVGYVKPDQENMCRYFVNVATLHLSAKAGYHASKYKRFGKLCYVLGALEAFMNHKNQDMNIRVDGGDWKQVQQVSAMAVGNAKYFGGGMKITPGANPSSGDFEVVTLQGFKWYDFLLEMPKLYRGTHVLVKNVSTERAHTIEVAEAGYGSNDSMNSKVFVQTDGEHIGFLPATFSLVPGAIDLLV